MAELRNPYTGGTVTVADDQVEDWLSRGFWVAEEQPKPAPKKRSKKTDDE